MGVKPINIHTCSYQKCHVQAEGSEWWPWCSCGRKFHLQKTLRCL